MRESLAKYIKGLYGTHHITVFDARANKSSAAAGLIHNDVIARSSRVLLLPSGIEIFGRATSRGLLYIFPYIYIIYTSKIYKINYNLLG